MPSVAEETCQEKPRVESSDVTNRNAHWYQVPVKWYGVENAVEAMAFLQRQGKYGHVPTPDLVLLDLNMPKRNGRQVLAEMKQDEELRSSPVVILTTSSAEADILKSYKLGAGCYITKPVGLKQFMHVVQSIDNFWFTVVKLPTRTKNEHK